MAFGSTMRPLPRDVDQSGAATARVTNPTMKARDLMMQEAVTVKPNDSVQHVARVLLANRISAVPVVGECDELLGIVSEGDLLRRAEAGTERTGSWWVGKQTAGVRQILAEDFVKSHATRVSDIMSRYVITAAPDTPLRDIVALFEINHIKRVPIVEDDKIVGIVSRADFLKALAATPERIVDTTSSADDAVGEDLMARLKEHSWLRTDLINIAIQDGVVNLWGIVGSDAEKSAVRVAAEATGGVQSVNDYLIIRTTAFER